MDIEQAILDLQKQMADLQKSFLQMSRNNYTPYNQASMAANKIPQVDDNTAGIQTNSDDILTTQEGLAQTYEETQTNAQDILATQEGLAETYEETYTSITNLEEALAEVYEMVLPTDDNKED